MLTSATSSSGPPSRTERNTHPELRKIPSTAEQCYHRTRPLQYCPETAGQGKPARWLGIIGRALARSGVYAASCPERSARMLHLNRRLQPVEAIRLAIASPRSHTNTALRG